MEITREKNIILSIVKFLATYDTDPHTYTHSRAHIFPQYSVYLVEMCGANKVKVIIGSRGTISRLTIVIVVIVPYRRTMNAASRTIFHCQPPLPTYFLDD